MNTPIQDRSLASANPAEPLNCAGQANLLLELRTEELPPRALPALSEAFARTLVAGLEKRGLVAPGAQVQRIATPRRLGLHLTGVLAQAPARRFEQRLVPVAIGLDAQGQATPALQKKLGALGLAWDAAQIHRESDGRQEVLVYRGERAGEALAPALQASLEEALAALPIPKVMNYQLADGSTTVQFVRPAHSLVALHGAAVVPLAVLGLTSGRTTCGHRFHAPQALEVRDADAYGSLMGKEGHVVVDFEARRERIRKDLQHAATQLGCEAVMPEALLDEVCALVEWPVVLESGFDPEFLAVPASCLILTMQQNQKYFALRDGQGRLHHRFLLVSNIAATDPSSIISGNARVVRARLADAKFFFDQDRLSPLATRLAGAAAVVYHRGLGSQAERNARIEDLAVRIARLLPGGSVQVEEVARAAHLAKADLGTLMVGEFPELQGEMGGIYARAGGEAEAVARAVEDHYRPRQAGDAVPGTLTGACVALADKLEALAGLMGAGERASGDRDPHALRRNALGVLRILQEHALALDLHALIGLAFAVFDPARLPAGFKPCPDELARFLADRLRGLLVDQGHAPRTVEAVLALQPGRIDLLAPRLQAVAAFLALPEAEHLAAANKRIGNLLRKGGVDGAAVGPIDPAHLAAGAEQALAQAQARVQGEVDAALAAGNDAAALLALAPLRPDVDRYFDEVMVMAEDPALRANRLALLGRLRTLMNRVADISLLAAG